jgi:hypothetical protein
LAGTVGFGDGEVSLGVQLEFPASLVGEVVVFAAQRQHVAHVGLTIVTPVRDVVHRAVLKRHCTAGRTAR